MSNISSTTSVVGTVSEFKPTATYFAISYTVTSIAIVLNFIEIYLIVRKWKQVTNFELVLLNLAVADVLNSALYTIITGLSNYSFINRGANRLNLFWVLGFHSFSVFASMSFVIAIGVERFFAIKLPLKHRLWHTGKRKILKYVIIVWVFDIVVSATIISIDYFINGKNTSILSKDLTYVIAGFLTIGLIFVSILYFWLGHLILMRSMKLFEFDKKDFSINPKAIKRAMKKDRATIIVCLLVVICLFTCNFPLIIDLYMKRITQASLYFLKLNSVANPIIYFFKGYLERYYGKKKLMVSSDPRDPIQDKGSAYDKAENGECNKNKSSGIESVIDQIKDQ